MMLVIVQVWAGGSKSIGWGYDYVSMGGSCDYTSAGKWRVMCMWAGDGYYIGESDVSVNWWW